MPMRAGSQPGDEWQRGGMAKTNQKWRSKRPCLLVSGTRNGGRTPADRCRAEPRGVRAARAPAKRAERPLARARCPGEGAKRPGSGRAGNGRAQDDH